MAESVGVWWSYLAALAVCLVWNGALWLVRNYAKTRAISAR
jgi:hypothetical protein